MFTRYLCRLGGRVIHVSRLDRPRDSSSLKVIVLVGERGREGSKLMICLEV